MTRADDEATFEVIAAHVDELQRERCQVTGLPDDEIARIREDLLGRVLDEVENLHPELREAIESAALIANVASRGDSGLEVSLSFPYSGDNGYSI